MFEKHFDYVCHTLRRLGVQPADLEDVAQGVFLAVLRRFDDYDPARPARPWLVAFAYRAASNYRRSERRRPEEFPAEDSDRRLQVDGNASAEQADQKRDIQRVLDQMSLEKKTVLLLFDVDGYTAPEIAEALEISLNTVYSRIRLARSEFRTLGAELFASRGPTHG
ncbi:MAG: sigma-70 family RNA polymerase sigma factor [Myxococcota bacterium]